MSGEIDPFEPINRNQAKIDLKKKINKGALFLAMGLIVGWAIVELLIRFVLKW